MSCYEEQVKNCTGPTSPWGNWADLWAITIKYEEFKSEKIDDFIAKIPQTQTGPDEKESMQKKVDALKSRQFLWFRATEAARLLYRSNMNQIFSCAIIASRWSKLEKLDTIVKKNGKASDILQKLDKEKKRYESLMRNKNCFQNNSDKADDKVVDRLSFSAAGEYCRYTYYLDYISANITSDFSAAVEIDRKIGGNTGTTEIGTTIAASTSMGQWMTTLESERSRANSTIPKAVVAFQEMDRTYITHLLLIIIYDDYLKLRDRLNTYMSIVSQTFEKAYNAQDANKR